MKILTCGLLAVSLAACAQTGPKVDATIATATHDLQTAVTAYGVVKGIADVAALSDPTLAPVIAKAEAVTDPLVATAQLALADATTDAPTVAALAAQINSQVTALSVTAAPAIKVVAGK